MIFDSRSLWLALSLVAISGCAQATSSTPTRAPSVTAPPVDAQPPAPVVPQVTIPLTETITKTTAKSGKGGKVSSKAVSVSQKTPPEMYNATEIDQAIGDIAKYAQHYPTYFATPADKVKARATIKQMISTVDPLAVVPNASFDVLIRAAKLNGLGRNLDLGSDAAVKSMVYMRRAVSKRPTDADANYWFGVMITEGGGLTEGLPYLQKALKLGVDDANLALANTYMNMGKPAQAQQFLNTYAAKFPKDPRLTAMRAAITSGTTASIWTPADPASSSPSSSGSR